MKPLLDMIMWKGKDLTEPHSFDKEYKKLMIFEKGRISLPREEAPNWLPSTNLSALKSYIQLKLRRLICVYVCVFDMCVLYITSHAFEMGIKENMRRLEGKGNR